MADPILVEVVSKPSWLEWISMVATVVIGVGAVWAAWTANRLSREAHKNEQKLRDKINERQLMNFDMRLVSLRSALKKILEIQNTRPTGSDRLITLAGELQGLIDGVLQISDAEDFLSTKEHSSFIYLQALLSEKRNKQYIGTDEAEDIVGHIEDSMGDSLVKL